MIIISILLVCAAAAYWLLKSGPKNRHARKLSRKAQRPGKLHKLYHSASINYGGCACTAVKSLGETRFLAEHAPQIPLPNCDSNKCQCRYVRHEDRRVEEDRRSLYCLQADLHIVAGEEEHRSKKGRRRTDGPTGTISDLSYDDFKWAT
ncbi:MAG: hypothetical protein IMF06_05255 [Proteobacteria bacterium]|nr:hypothetical protein [Pseudomonadota bacterium]